MKQEAQTRRRFRQEQEDKEDSSSAQPLTNTSQKQTQLRDELIQAWHLQDGIEAALQVRIGYSQADAVMGEEHGAIGSVPEQTKRISDLRDINTFTSRQNRS
jgi:hypothetical protein